VLNTARMKKNRVRTGFFIGIFFLLSQLCLGSELYYSPNDPALSKYPKVVKAANSSFTVLLKFNSPDMADAAKFQKYLTAMKATPEIVNRTIEAKKAAQARGEKIFPLEFETGFSGALFEGKRTILTAGHSFLTSELLSSLPADLRRKADAKQRIEWVVKIIEDLKIKILVIDNTGKVVFGDKPDDHAKLQFFFTPQVLEAVVALNGGNLDTSKAIQLFQLAVDATVLQLSRDIVGVTPLQSASRKPQVGETIFFPGYPESLNSKFAITLGNIEGPDRLMAALKIAPNHKDTIAEMILSVGARSDKGMSGCPALNTDGEVVSVLSGSVMTDPNSGSLTMGPAFGKFKWSLRAGPAIFGR
jgi:hypothetical protein